MSWFKDKWKSLFKWIAIAIAIIALVYLAAGALALGGFLSAGVVGAMSFGVVAAGASTWAIAGFFILVAVAGLALAAVISPEAVEKVLEKLKIGVEKASEVLTDLGEEALDMAGDLLKKGMEKAGDLLPKWLLPALGVLTGVYVFAKFRTSSKEADPVGAEPQSDSLTLHHVRDINPQDEHLTTTQGYYA